VVWFVSTEYGILKRLSGRFDRNNPFDQFRPGIGDQPTERTGLRMDQDSERAQMQAILDNSPDWLTLFRAAEDGRFLYEDLNRATERAYALGRNNERAGSARHATRNPSHINLVNFFDDPLGLPHCGKYAEDLVFMRRVEPA
jgi:hypothetical protein